MASYWTYGTVLLCERPEPTSNIDNRLWNTKEEAIQAACDDYNSMFYDNDGNLEEDFSDDDLLTPDQWEERPGEWGWGNDGDNYYFVVELTVQGA